MEKITRLANIFVKLAQESPWWIPLELKEFAAKVNQLDINSIVALYDEIKIYAGRIVKAFGPKAADNASWIMASKKMAIANKIKQQKEAGAASTGGSVGAVIDKVLASPIYNELVRKADAAVSTLPKQSVPVTIDVKQNGIVSVTSTNPSVTTIFSPLKSAVENALRSAKVTAAPYNTVIIRLPN